MLNLQQYGFKIVSGSSEGSSLEATIRRLLPMVFVGWRSEWELERIHSHRPDAGFALVSSTRADGTALTISVSVWPVAGHATRKSVHIEVYSVSDEDEDEFELHRGSILLPNVNENNVDSATENLIHNALKKAVADAKENADEVSDEVSSIVRAWRS